MMVLDEAHLGEGDTVDSADGPAWNLLQLAAGIVDPEIGRRGRAVPRGLAGDMQAQRVGGSRCAAAAAAPSDPDHVHRHGASLPGCCVA